MEEYLCFSQLKHGRGYLFIDSCGGLGCHGREPKLVFSWEKGDENVTILQKLGM